MAQTSAGQMLQQIETLRPPDNELPEPSREAPSQLREVVPPKTGEVSITVRAFRFEGNTLVSRKVLEDLVSPYLNKPLTFDDLQRITELIVDYYQKEGWLARAILPQQDITDGTVTIRILEGRFSRVIIDNQSERIDSARVERWIYDNLPQGSELSLDRLDRAVLTLNDQPDLNVAASLREGSTLGETELLLTVTDRPRFAGQVAFDNFGDSNTGKARGSVSAIINGLGGFGDQVSIYGLYTAGSSYGRLGYTFPIGSDGLRVGINGSAMSYRVLNSSFQTLGNNGSSATGGLDASYPMIRGRSGNLTSILNWNYNSFRNWNYLGSQAENTYDTSVAQFGFYGNLFDEYLGGGVNTTSLIGSAGSISKNAWTQSGIMAGVAGTFAKFRYGYTRTQNINDVGLAGYVSISGQLASQNMDSSEQMYLGGPSSVRAYAGGQGAASQGNLTTLELRQTLPYQTMITAFYDIGNVQAWKFNTQHVNYNSYVLQGFGLGLNWLGPYGLSVKGTWAQRTGQLNQAVATYLYQNGGTSANRFWVTATLPF